MTFKKVHCILSYQEIDIIIINIKHMITNETFMKAMANDYTLIEYIKINCKGINNNNVGDFIEYLIDSQVFQEHLSMFAEDFLQKNN